MYILGLDIGYSNLKLAFSESNNVPATQVLPIGAAPASFLPMKFGKSSKGGDLQVLINDEPWVVGVEPSRLEGWERELHAEYPTTDSYLALLYGALLNTGKKEIDLVVTGLPVNQFLDKELVEKLKGRIRGKHQITKNIEISVKDAFIVPQPTGTFANTVTTVDEQTAENIESGNTVVIDPGFFSVDWVLLKGSELHRKSSGTSLKAMSMLLTQADIYIQQEFGTTVGVEVLERAIRNNTPTIQIFGTKIDISDFLARASKDLCLTALTPMRKTMREESAPIDYVLLTGGGATYYQEAAQAIFPKSTTIVCEESVLANAKGFFYIGQSLEAGE